MLVRARPALALVLLAVLVAVPPAILGGTPERGNDFDFHTSAVADYRAALADGVVYPRWAASTFGGFGAPTFVFYPPLPHASVASVAAITGDPITAFQCVALVVAALGAFGAYRLVRREAGPRTAAVAAIAWALLPYAAIDYYTRFAWAEYCALAWIPFVFLAARDLVSRGGAGAAARWVIGCAGLALTHLLTAAICCPVAAIWIAAEAARRRSAAVLVRTALLSGLACLLAAPYLVPVVVEASHVRLDFTHTVLYGRVHNGGFPWIDPAAYGYSRPARAALDWAAAGHVALTAGAIATLAWCRALTGTSALLAIGAAGLLFLVGPWAEPIWRVATPLQSLQFAYRLLGVQGLLAVWLAARAITAAGRRPRRVGVPVRVGIVASVAIGLALAWDGQHGSKRPHDAEELRAPVNNVVFEYLPRAVDFASASAHHARLGAPFAIAGEAQARLLAHETHETRVAVEAGPDGATLVFRRFDFPGWRVTIDGTPVAHETVPDVGAIAVSVPPGEHRVCATHGATPARRLGGWLALAALVAAIAAWRRLAATRGAPTARGVPGMRVTIACLAALVVVGLILPVAWPYPRLVRNLVVVSATPALDEATAPSVRDAVTRHVRPGATAREDATDLFVAPGGFEAFGAGPHVRRAFIGGAPDLAALLPGAVATTPADALARADAWLERRDREPFAVWLHVGAASRDSLAAVVRRVDARLVGSPHDEHTDVVVLGLGGAGPRGSVVRLRTRPPRPLPTPDAPPTVGIVPTWLDADRR